MTDARVFGFGGVVGGGLAGSLVHLGDVKDVGGVVVRWRAGFVGAVRAETRVAQVVVLAPAAVMTYGEDVVAAAVAVIRELDGGAVDVGVGAAEGVLGIACP